MKDTYKKIIMELLSKRTSASVCETSTLKDLGMDSLDFVDFIIDLETEFIVEIPPEYFSIEEMGTVQQITEMIEMLQNDK